MARVLLTWELGGGLGHLMNLRPFVIGLLDRGHEVILAVKDLSRVRQVVDCSNLTLIAAPWNARGCAAADPIVTFADVLLNTGFADLNSLKAHVSAWRSIFSAFKPDLIICDHSPTAILAARGMPFGVATIGTGFFCPPDESPLRMLFEIQAEQQSEVRQREGQLLDNINQIVCDRTLGSTLLPSYPPLDRVAELYHNEQVTHYLLTFRELDHFQGRGESTYWGAWPYGINGEAFERPAGRDPCLFAYLKPFPALPELLAKLSKARINSKIYVEGFAAKDKASFASERLRFADRPVNIQQAAMQCDIALTNANHGTCVAMLLAGTPMVHVPMYREQSLLGAAIDRAGASKSSVLTDASETCKAINQVLSDVRFRLKARAFAAKYHQYQEGVRIDQILQQLNRRIGDRSIYG